MIQLFTGLIAAFVHVISGPDHLAAVTPLAIESRKKSWIIGFSWGIGHTLGAMMIGLVFILFKHLISVEVISEHSEQIVGVILIGIGSWAIWKVLRSTGKEDHKHPHIHLDKTPYVHSHPHTHMVHRHLANEAHAHKHDIPVKQNVIAAISVGILHGFAGVSHLIAILPTLAFATTFQSGMYLGGFGIGTIFAMVVYAAIIGYLAYKSTKEKTGNLYRRVRLAGGSISILVGIFWIGLSFNMF